MLILFSPDVVGCSAPSTRSSSSETQVVVGPSYFRSADDLEFAVSRYISIIYCRTWDSPALANLLLRLSLLLLNHLPPQSHSIDYRGVAHLTDRTNCHFCFFSVFSFSFLLVGFCTRFPRFAPGSFAFGTLHFLRMTSADYCD